MEGVAGDMGEARLDARGWEELSARLRDELGWVRTHPWLDAARPRALDGSALWLEVPSGAARDAAWEQRGEVERVVAEHLGRRLRLRLVSPARRPRRARPAADGGQPPAEELGPLQLEPERVQERHDLASFITGPSNRLAAEFARQAIQEPGAWHPLVFYGERGCGKTHLLQGIVNGYRRRYPTRRVVYARSERFARQFSQALRRRQARRFREHYRDLSLLVLDDLEGLAGKPASEQELAHTLDHLLMVRQPTQVVVACHKAPKDIPQLQAGLEARLLGGQLVRLPTADGETRRHLLRAASLAQGLLLDPQVEELLTAQVELSLRELQAAATQLAAHHRHAGARIDLAAARGILRELLAGRREPPTLERLASFVAGETGVELEHLLGRARQPRVVRARNLSMGLARTLTKLTLREVGAFFGGRSVASVHGAHALALRLREEEPQARALWERAERRFGREGELALG
ncbi:MAG: DnaA/Hda family protein [Planctomycetota bacterium]